MLANNAGIFDVALGSVGEGLFESLDQNVD
jgi:hypothetical protein